jgi:C-methyltransferase C-terminal domain/Putative zinc binding domain/Methyltransferase domain
MHVITRTTCRVCGSSVLCPVMNLGPQFLSNLFVTEESRPPLRRVPLELVRCDTTENERACGLVQLRHTVPPEIMFETYWYVSGINQTMRSALQDIALRAESLVELKPGDAVVDIGCNDCTLLQQYQTTGIRRVGFDPARNLGNRSDRNGVEVIEDFFAGRTYLEQIRQPAKIVTSIAMFYDLEDPKRFVRDVRAVLDPRGVWIVQMSYLPIMLAQTAFDNICHEHLCYYSLATMEYLLKDEGLRVVDVDVNDINGGSFRLFIQRADALECEPTRRVHEMRRCEFELCLESDSSYRQFATRAEAVRRGLRRMIAGILKRGKTVYVYGASTKGNVLLQYCGLSAKQIPYAIDRNPQKWGARTLGTDIPIISEEEGRKRRPDYLLVLPWHFLPEFLDRETDYLEKGGTLIVPLPKLVQISKGNAAEYRGLVRLGHEFFEANSAFRSPSYAH